MASVPLYGSNKQSSSHSMHCSSVGGTLWPVFLFMKLIRNIMIEDTRVLNLHFGLWVSVSAAPLHRAKPRFR